MRKERRHLNILAKRGMDATITIIAGISCPCLASRDGNYNPQFHDDYPAIENCSGSGLISRVKTTTEVKSDFTNDQETIPIYMKSEEMEEIGRRNKIDVIMFGAVKMSDYSKFDLSLVKEHSDYITFQSTNYKFCLSSWDFGEN